MNDLTEIFSPLEIEVLKALKTDKLTVGKLADRVYKTKKPVLDQNNSVNCTIRMINKKCVFHDLNWFINGTGLGRTGKTVWKDQR